MSSYRAERAVSLTDAEKYRALEPHPLEENNPAEANVMLLRELLDKGVHGFCFSGYNPGQKPGDMLEKDQLRERMGVLAPHTRWVRSFSCVEGNEHIPAVAREFGVKTMVGAWLCGEPDKDEAEIEALIRLAREGVVDLAAVGNEVLYRDEMPKDALIALIERVKKAVPDVPVGYVDAYYEFVRHPDLTAACDVLFTNCYPFWESCPFPFASGYMKDMYHQVMRVANGKRVVISETGWPSAGNAVGGAQPSRATAAQYFINAMLWANAHDVEIFYFTSFDETWKTADEGDVGAYWGLWDEHNQLKF